MKVWKKDIANIIKFYVKLSLFCAFVLTLVFYILFTRGTKETLIFHLGLFLFAWIFVLVFLPFRSWLFGYPIYEKKTSISPSQIKDDEEKLKKAEAPVKLFYKLLILYCLYGIVIGIFRWLFKILIPATVSLILIFYLKDSIQELPSEEIKGEPEPPLKVVLPFKILYISIIIYVIYYGIFVGNGIVVYYGIIASSFLFIISRKVTKSLESKT